MLGGRPTAGHFYAFLPNIPKVFGACGLVPAVLPGGRSLRARMGVIASDDVTGVHLLPKVLFDAALPGQRPPPGQQRPQAPAATEPGAWAALGGGVSGAGSQLLVTPAVQATVRAPGGPAAGPAASVFGNGGVLGVGAGRGAPGLRREPGARRGLVRGAGPEGPGLPGRGGVPYALPVPELAALGVLLRHLRDTAQPLRARALRGALWLLTGRCFGAPTVMALLGERVTRGRAARERGSVTWAGGRENTALVSAAARGWGRRAARPERGDRPCGTRGPHEGPTGALPADKAPGSGGRPRPGRAI